MCTSRVLTFFFASKKSTILPFPLLITPFPHGFEEPQVGARLQYPGGHEVPTASRGTEPSGLGRVAGRSRPGDLGLSMGKLSSGWEGAIKGDFGVPKFPADFRGAGWSKENRVSQPSNSKSLGIFMQLNLGFS